jgi:hypothetical protein
MSWRILGSLHLHGPQVRDRGRVPRVVEPAPPTFTVYPKRLALLTWVVPSRRRQDVMPILSRRNAPKLLRSVNNQPHAGTRDHEEDAPRKANMKQTTTPHIESESDIFAEPMSSSDEKEAQPPPAMSQGSNTSTCEDARAGRAANSTPSKTAKAKAKARSMRVPKQGVFRTGLKHRDSFVDGEKENSQEGPLSSDGKSEADGTVYFGMGDTPPKKRKSKNLHTAPVAGSNRKSFGKDKRRWTLELWL